MGPVRLNAFTVDVEDYFQVSAFARQVDPRTWDQYESRVEPNTDRILRILEKRGTRGTFFILGWVAERFPGLVKRIDAAGHEIGSHSYWHRLVYDLNPDEFQSDLERSCDVLEQLIGKKVRLFRAASFSVVERSLWALQILAERGIELDSSIFPVRHDRYGIPGARIEPYRLDLGGRSLWEFLSLKSLPVVGSFYVADLIWSKLGGQTSNQFVFARRAARA